MTIINISKRGPGYVCDCISGSPEPGVVKFDSKLHDLGCPVRKRIFATAISVTATDMMRDIRVILPIRAE